MSSMPTHRLVRLVNVGLLIGAGMFVFRLTTVIRHQNAVIQARDAVAARSVVHDRLVGARVDLGLLGGTPSESTESSGEVLLWIVDPASCGRCVVEGFGAWDALAADPELRRRLVVIGKEELPREARRAVRGTEVTRVSREEASLALGTVLPNTKLLVDHRGIVLMADSRSASSECGWSFEAQVGALRGVLAGETIRN